MDSTMEEPLVGGRRKVAGRYDRSCFIPTVAAAVLGVMFLACFIGLIAVGASWPDSCDCKNVCDSSSTSPVPVVSSSSSSHPIPPEPSSSSEPPQSSSSKPQSSSSSSSSSLSSSSTHIVFSQFNATVLALTCSADMYHCSAQDPLEYSAWAPGKMLVDQFDADGNSVLREFSTEEDDSITICQKFPGHGNCYRMTSSDDATLDLDGLVLLEQNVACTDLIPHIAAAIAPLRPLDKCDYYTLVYPFDPEMNEDVMLQVVVESGNNYPVWLVAKYLGEKVISGEVFATFEPGEPQDESRLQPYPDVHVYDFRDGESVSEEQTFTAKRDATSNVFINQLLKQKKINEYLHRPPVPVGKYHSSAARQTALRDDIPDTFDARQQWPDCADVIGTITNQDVCGSCWAMSSAGVLGDRMCISHNAKVVMSPQYMVYCGENTSGCNGGATMPVWDQLMYQGTVSEDCVPFTGRDGICPTECKNYTDIDDNMVVKTYGTVYPWGDTDESRVQAIQSEIMQYGPVQASYMVFTDFYQYSSGIYSRTKQGKFVGNHAVRLIGWGTDNNVDYWLVANSWGKGWGEDGLFRIRRGTNECNFEEGIAAGMVNQ